MAVMQGRERRLLVVEDDPDLREALVTVLVDAGYAVEAAPECEAALTLLGQRPPDVIVLDMMMDGTNGWAFLAAKSRDPSLATIPVVVTSGSKPARPPRGVVAWLQKPFDFAELLRVLKPWA